METKICTCCKQEKSIEEFSFRNKEKGTRRSECKVCRRKKDNEYYQSSKKRQEDIRMNHILQKERNRKFIEDYKRKGECKKCGENRFYMLDFHHIDSTEKDFNISEMRDCGLRKIQQEIDKCVLLCANCHREFHYLEKEKNISFEKYINAS